MIADPQPSFAPTSTPRHRRLLCWGG